MLAHRLQPRPTIGLYFGHIKMSTNYRVALDCIIGNQDIMNIIGDIW